jgi:inhibitor of cysteine peptidase
MTRARRFMAIGFIGIVLAGSLVGCAAKSTPPLELSSADSGTIQRPAIGQQIKVSLDSNPTTGYRWALNGALPSQIEQVGDPKFTAQSSAVGAGGVEVWTFVGKSAGACTLKLKYWRSFEPTAVPGNVFEVALDVR